MEDLKTILAGRSAFYSKAQLRINTSDQSLGDTFVLLRQAVRGALGVPM
jgi:XRE family aerobic/anaerobic benzoate catabolism transcriptional regulator